MNVKRKVVLLFALAALAALGGCVEEEHVGSPHDSEEHFQWVISDGGVVITGFAWEHADVRIPPQIQGLPVVGIRDRAFEARRPPWAFTAELQITGVDIPDGVLFIGERAFADNLLNKRCHSRQRCLHRERGVFE